MKESPLESNGVSLKCYSDYEELEPLQGSWSGRTFNYMATNAPSERIFDYTLACQLRSDQCPTESEPFFLNIYLTLTQPQIHSHGDG